MSDQPLLAWTLSFLRPYRKRVALLAALLLGEIGLGALQPLPLKVVIDYVLLGHPIPEPFAGWLATIHGGDPVTLLVTLVAAGVALQITNQLVSAYGTQVQVDAGQRMVYDLRYRLFQHLQALGLHHHITTSTGDAVYRVDVDAYAIENLVMSGLFPLATSTITLVVMFAILLKIDVTVALLSLIVVPFLYLCLRYYARTMVNREERVKELESKLVERLYESFSAIRLVKSFAREPHEASRYAAAGDKTMDARIAVTWQQSLFSVVVSTITILGTALVMIVGGVHVMRGQMTLGSLTMVIAYLGAVYGPLSSIAHTTGQLQGALAGARRVRAMFALIPETADAPDAIDAAGVTGTIRFEDVGFSYPDGTQVLHDISFEARPGQVVALVGLTGAGKTTLVSLIPRFYDAAAGRVLVDGVDVRKYRVRSLRERIAIVLQDPVLFSGTIRDNLRYGNLDATPDEVEQAARAAHAHEFIARLAKGYDTEIAEAGGGLSGGERQRLSVARAILKNAPILILDEPTSSLDAISEEIVFSALRRLRAGRTTIVIAHRLSTVRDADQILVLDGGKIAAQGRHEDLLKSSQLYRRMCARLSVGKSLDDPETVDELIEAAADDSQTLMRILFAGIIARYPFGGVTWCSLMYLLGLRALGHEVFYIEDTGECVYDPVLNTRATDPAYGTSYIRRALEPFGLGDRWAFVNYDGGYHGRSADEVRRYAADTDLFINLSGGSWFWRDEYARIPRKVFVDSDPAFTQLALAKAGPWYVEFFRGFDRLFTFGSNIGTAASAVPTGDFEWHHTWQPVTVDDWRTDTVPRDRFTSVMTWQIESFADVGGNKDQEFVKFVDLPSRTPQRLELAINGPQALLRAHGWDTVDAMRVSRTPHEYRDFIHGSKAEFGVAKHTYVATRSGWFSDRTECYLASGRPALVQDTGWTAHLPSGDGLLAFSTPDEAIAGIDRINSDYAAHAGWAREIAREYFDARVVLPRLLEAAS